MKTIVSNTAKNISFDIEPKQYNKYKVLVYFTDKDKDEDSNHIARLRLNTLKEIKEIESILSVADWTLPIDEISVSKKHFSAFSQVNRKFN